jgi:ubiquitin carboxyl-terminal hydrolase 5/13
MTCGHLGCARRNFDGSGGNGHGVAHYESSRHALVCKIGTITPEGAADIHCYLCDEQRLDHQLVQHLQTFGIEVSQQQKTEKSLAEMVSVEQKN